MRLVEVQGGMRLEASAAAAWFALVEAGRARFSVAAVLSSPAGAWRSDELVRDMFLHPAKYGASQGTAKPRSMGGPGSVHENGWCVDVNNWRQFGDLVVSRGFRRSRRLDTLAAGFGYRPDSRYPNEPWHYQYDGTTIAGGGTTPFEEERDDMTTGNLYQYPSDGPRTTRAGSIPAGGTTHDFRPRQGDLFWEREPGAPLYLVPSAAQYTRLVNAGLLPLTMDVAEIDGLCAVQGVTASPWLSVAPVTVTTGEVHVTADSTAVVAAIEALGLTLAGKLDALPAEIDAYSDGRK